MRSTVVIDFVTFVGNSIEKFGEPVNAGCGESC